MTLTPVKTSAGSRLRHPKTKAVMPNVEDAEAEAVMVNLADPHWYKALQCGDIEVTDPATLPEWYRDLMPAEPAAEAPAPAKPAQAKAAPQPAAAAPAADAAPTPKS